MEIDFDIRYYIDSGERSILLDDGASAPWRLRGAIIMVT